MGARGPAVSREARRAPPVPAWVGARLASVPTGAHCRCGEGVNPGRKLSSFNTLLIPLPEGELSFAYSSKHSVQWKRSSLTPEELPSADARLSFPPPIIPLTQMQLINKYYALL